MFKELRPPIAIPRWAAVWTAVLGAFGTGIFTGKLLAGAKPFDWTLDITNALWMLGVTIWLAIKAMRNDAPRAGNVGQ